MCAQSVHQLGAVDNDREAVTGGGDDLLMQQGAAAPLDQIESAVFHLVRAIDREIELSMLGKCRQHDTGGCRLGRRALRGGNGDKAQTLPATSRERRDGKSSR